MNTTNDIDSQIIENRIKLINNTFAVLFIAFISFQKYIAHDIVWHVGYPLFLIAAIGLWGYKYYTHKKYGMPFIKTWQVVALIIVAFVLIIEYIRPGTIFFGRI